jgi:hypothetical protein
MKIVYRPRLVWSLVLVAACSFQPHLVQAQTLPESEELGPAQLLEKELRDVITSWASAWQSQLDDVYLLHYHPDFEPEDFKGRADWEASRRDRIRGPAGIRITMRGFEVVESSQDRALVRFVLIYSRPGYEDQTRKELNLRKFGQIWLIYHEHNLEVTRVAPP